MTQPCHEVNVNGGVTVESLRVRLGPGGVAAKVTDTFRGR